MSAIFQGYANSNGRVRAAEVTKVPAGSANHRGMIVAGNVVIPFLVDAGQPRVFHSGIAFDQVTGLLLAGRRTATPLNVSMGGLLVDVNGAVVLEELDAQVIHQGVGLRNDGALAIEREPIATFIAHLHNNVASTTGPGDFERQSPALYQKANGDWRVALDDEPRFENDQLLMEPAATNKCVNWNANPDPGVTNVVGAGATVTRVSRPNLIKAAGLQNICTDGNVIELHNETAGLVTSYINGVTGNTNPHTASLFMNTFGDNIRIGLDGTGLTSYATTSLERCTHSGTPDNTTRVLSIQLDPGEKCQFVLNQLEESVAVSSPIITQGAAASRAIDVLEYSDVANFFNQTQGMLLLQFRPWYGSAEQVAVDFTDGVISLNNSDFSLLYARSPTATAMTFRSYAGPGQFVESSDVVWVVGDLLNVAVRWNRTASQWQVGYKNGGSWQWGTEGPISIDFPLDGLLRVMRAVSLPTQVSDLTLYDEDRGRTWIEANH